MQNIVKVSEKMKKKLSFGDYAPLNPENSSPVSEVKARKIYQISKKDMLMLEEIFSMRLSNEKPVSFSAIMSEAIELLYRREINATMND